MKTSALVLTLTRSFLFVSTFLFSSISMFAQGGLDIDVDIDRKEWYEQPWAWVVGGAVFILILVALLRRQKR